MNKIFKLSAFFALCLMMVGITGCQEELVSTDQYQETGVVLNSYGPQPVLRGGILRFLGTNLDKVTEVILPGAVSVTEINVVKAGVPSEIQITVPVEGPEPGKITLKTADGQEIVTKTELTYSEPIVLESFAPASVAAGDVITLKGDYFNLVHEVIFSDKIYVSEKDFLKHTRYEIQVKVPVEARTGKIAVGDLDELNNEDPNLMANTLFSEKELTVAQPEVTKMEAARYKAGETVTITGKNFQYVDKIVLPGVAEVQSARSNTQISFELPAEAQDGEVVLVAKSGVEVVAGKYETVVPTEVAAAPQPVKAGATLTVTGKDLDLVYGIDVPGKGSVDFQYGESITFEMPEEAYDAVYDEESKKNNPAPIVLNMANGKSVTVAYTLVKPVAKAYSVNPASAGSDMTITGTDLDLVKSVTFGGDLTVDVEATAEAITVAVPTTAETGVLKLNLANGTSVDCEELKVDKPVACYITELPGADVEIKGGTILTVPLANEDLLEKVLVNGEEVQFIRIKKALHISLPDLAGPGTVITLISSNGQVEYTIDCIPNTIIEKVIWTGPQDLGSWSINLEIKPGDLFVNADMKVGQKIRFYVTPTADWWQIQFFDGMWNALAVPEGVDPKDETAAPTNNINPNKVAGATVATDGFVELTVTEELKTILTTKIEWGNSIIVQGENLILNKITYYEDNSEVAIMEESRNLGSWAKEDSGGAFRLYKADLTVAKFAPGKTLKFYVEQFAYAQLQINDANWGNITCPQYNAGEAPAVIEVPVDQAFYDKVMNTSDGWSDTGMVVQGEGLIVHKVTVK